MQGCAYLKVQLIKLFSSIHLGKVLLIHGIYPTNLWSVLIDGTEISMQMNADDVPAVKRSQRRDQVNVAAAFPTLGTRKSLNRRHGR